MRAFILITTILINLLIPNNTSSKALDAGVIVPTVFVQAESGQFRLLVMLNSINRNNIAKITILSEDGTFFYKNSVHFEWSTQLRLLLPKGNYRIIIIEPDLPNYIMQKHLILR